MAPYEVVEQIDRMSDEEFLTHARELLERELGVYGLARFIRLYRPGSGNYTEERHAWLDNLSVRDILNL